MQNIAKSSGRDNTTSPPTINGPQPARSVKQPANTNAAYTKELQQHTHCNDKAPANVEMQSASSSKARAPGTSLPQSLI
jgi:hypothetical protein